MNFKFYRNIFSQEQEYRVGQVRYIVESHFCPFPDPEQKTMRDRVERLLTGDLVNLTLLEVTDTIEEENVCSVAGKEN